MRKLKRQVEFKEDHLVYHAFVQGKYVASIVGYKDTHKWFITGYEQGYSSLEEAQKALELKLQRT